MQNYYFTFGNDPKYPFGIDEYIVIRATDIAAALSIFQSYYPNRDNSDCLNFAFCYPESEWIAKNMCKKYYNGKVPEVIYE